MSTSVATLLDANLAAHRARWGFAPAIDVDATRVRVDTTNGPWARVSIQMPDGRWLRVHSDRQPIDEAVRTLTQHGATTGEAPLVCLIGAGLGYTVEVLQARAAPAARILVIEPEPTFLRLCLERRDWTALIESGRLMMLGGPVYDGRTEAWRLVTPDGPDPIVIAHPVIGEAREAEAREALQVIARAVTGARANDEARRQFAGRYLLNTLRNLSHIVNGGDPGVLAGRLTGVPAIVVGAGPSLDASLPALRAVGDRAVIIATDTSWRPLATAGITPALVVAADPSEINGRHLIDVRASHEPDETWLVAEASVAPRALEASTGRVATFRLSEHHPWPWLDAAGLPRPKIRIWGSVLTAAFDLALTCGCDPIVFAGADLSYTDDRPYCRGTTFELDWAKDAARGCSPRQIWTFLLANKSLITVPGLDGRDARTTEALIEFRNWLLARIGERTDRRFINTSGAGILFGAGITQQTLESAFANRPARHAEIRAALRLLQQSTASAPRDRRALEQMLDAAIDETSASRPGGSESTASSSPLPDWLAFGRPSLTREEIHDGLVSGRDALRRMQPDAQDPTSRTAAAAPNARWPLRMHAADRVARLRALLSGDEYMLDGVSPDILPEGRTLEDVHASIRRAFDALLELPPPVTLELPVNADLRTTPLSHRYTWTDAAAPVLAYLEEALVDRAELIGPRAPADVLGDTFWTRRIRRVYDENEDIDAEVSADAIEGASTRDVLLCFPPIQQWLLDERTGETDAPRSNRERRLTAATLQGLAEPLLRTRREREGDLQLCGRSLSPEPYPVRIDAVMRALTGTIATASSRRDFSADRGTRGLTLRVATSAPSLDDEPRYAFLGPGLSHVEPVILTDSGMPPSWHCHTSSDADLAIVTPYGACHSLLVAADGTWTQGPDWPIAISGELPWGAEGGALAWNQPESTLMLRRAAGGEVECVTVPFRPQHLAIAKDGSAFWTAAEGGLWEWLPGRPGSLLVETPPCGSLLLEDGHVWLAPTVRNAQGQFVRVRRKAALRYTPDSRELAVIAAGGAGCATDRAARHGWTARPYGCSDLVTLTGPAGHSATVACYAPFRAAWSGSSLLLSTADGAILLFRNITDRVMAAG